MNEWSMSYLCSLFTNCIATRWHLQHLDGNPVLETERVVPYNDDGCQLFVVDGGVWCKPRIGCAGILTERSAACL